MSVSNNIKTEILSLIHSGYSLDSICKTINKRHKDVGITKSDIVIVAKQAGIQKFGKETKVKQNMNMSNVESMIPNLVNDTEVRGKVRNSIIIILMCIIVLALVLYFSFNLKVMLITMGSLIGIVALLVVFGYFKVIKKNDTLMKIVNSPYTKKGKNKK